MTTTGSLTLRAALMLAPIFCNPAQATNEPINIVKYITELVEVCTANGECKDVAASSLPDPESSKITVVSISADGMVEIILDGKPHYIHQSELELSEKATSSVACIDKPIAKRSDEQVFSTHGLGEGCNQ